MLHLSFALAFLIPSAAAAGVVIEPEPASLTQLQEQLSEEIAHAHIDLKGEGADLNVEYSSTHPISLYILFLDDDGSVNPRDILFAKLPEGNDVESIVPLSPTRGWRGGERSYKLHLITNLDGTQNLKSIGIGGSASIIDGLKQFFSPEPFTPSSYHRLTGYRFLGIPITLILTILIAIILIGSLILKRKQLGLIIILIIILLSNARFSLDTLKYTQKHLSDWSYNKTYETAGSTYEIAEFLESENIRSIQLCTDGNSYFQTLLKYAAYPLAINGTSKFILERYALECDTSNAEKTKEFPDGSIIFRINELTN